MRAVQISKKKSNFFKKLYLLIKTLTLTKKFYVPPLPPILLVVTIQSFLSVTPPPPPVENLGEIHNRLITALNIWIKITDFFKYARIQIFPQKKLFFSILWARGVVWGNFFGTKMFLRCPMMFCENYKNLRSKLFDLFIGEYLLLGGGGGILQTFEE